MADQQHMAEGAKNTTPPKEKDDEGKKRRFSSFIINHNYNNSNKRVNSAPTRILLVGRPQSGKSSITSMLLNRDVHPGLNGRHIYVGPKDETHSSSPQKLATPNDPPSPSMTKSSPTPITKRLSSRSAIAGLQSYSPMQSPEFTGPPQDNNDNEDDSGHSLDIIDPPTEMSISPPIRASLFVPQSTHQIMDDENNTPSLFRNNNNHTGRKIYQSDKYVITDIDGFNATNTFDSVGAVLEHRKWLEDTMQGYNIVLMVIKAQELSEIDRTVFALCNALLNDLRDMIHIVVTGCDTNPHWIKENEQELRKFSGTSKVVGVTFPSTKDGGLLECIFEEMRKDSLVVLEDYITKNATTNPRVPIRAAKGGSMNSKKPERTRTRTFSR